MNSVILCPSMSWGALWELQTEIRNAKYETGSEHVKRFIQTIYERLSSLQEGIARTARARRKAGPQNDPERGLQLSNRVWDLHP